MTSRNQHPVTVAPARRYEPGKHTRRWIPYSGAVLLTALIVAGLWPRPVPVEIARASSGPLRATVNEEGKTRIRQRYVVSAPVAGQLRRIPFKAGAEVRAQETVLAIIDPMTPALLDARTRSLAEARRDSAAANLEKARAAHEFASSEFQRFEKLYREQTVSVQEWEGAKLRESSAAKDLGAAEAAFRQAEAELAEFVAESKGDGVVPVEVKAPVSGRILRVLEESARAVTPGTPLVEVGDPSDLEVVIEVLSRDGAMIEPGTKMELQQWGGSKPLVAKVRLVEPAAFTKVSALGVEEQRVRVIADLVTPEQERAGLGDAFRVEGAIIIWEGEHVLKVPTGALFRHGEQWSTFVLQDGRAKLRSVNVGHSGGNETEILGGLKEGEEVILYPGSRIKEGQRVKRMTI